MGLGSARAAAMAGVTKRGWRDSSGSRKRAAVLAALPLASNDPLWPAPSAATIGGGDNGTAPGPSFSSRTCLHCDFTQAVSLDLCRAFRPKVASNCFTLYVTPLPGAFY